jgi:hypothetical protein
VSTTQSPRGLLLVHGTAQRSSVSPTPAGRRRAMSKTQMKAHSHIRSVQATQMIVWVDKRSHLQQMNRLNSLATWLARRQWLWTSCWHTFVSIILIKTLILCGQQFSHQQTYVLQNKCSSRRSHRFSLIARLWLTVEVHRQERRTKPRLAKFLTLSIFLICNPNYVVSSSLLDNLP